jgi:hypothetical protein
VARRQGGKSTRRAHLHTYFRRPAVAKQCDPGAVAIEVGLHIAACRIVVHGDAREIFIRSQTHVTRE